MDIAQWVDRPMLVLFGRIAQENAAIDRLILHVSSNDLIKGGLVVALLWWAWFDAGDEAWARRAGVVKTLIAGVLAAAVSRLMQNLMPPRPRPMHGSPDFVPPAGLGPDAIEWMRGLSSFPSDHAALFFALAVGLWLVSRHLGTLALAWGLIVVSLPRIYFGLHYPSDILAGAALGAMAAVALFALPVPRKDRLRGWIHARPALFYSAAFLICFELAELFSNLRALGTQALDSARLLLAAT